LDGKHSDSVACGAKNRTAPVRLRRATSTTRFRAARPVTFFGLAKKVNRESRACEGALRVPCAARGRGRACALARCGRSDSQALNIPRVPCAARRLRRHSTASRLAELARQRGESARARRSGAERRRSRAGRVSEPVARRSRDRASFAHGPLKPRSARAAGAPAQVGLVRSPLFGDSLWRSKESHSPPGDSRFDHSSGDRACRATARFHGLARGAKEECAAC
jgi:hypothetical protein